MGTEQAVIPSEVLLFSCSKTTLLYLVLENETFSTS